MANKISFIRNLGGTLGLAIAGTIMYVALPSYIPKPLTIPIETTSSGRQ